MPETFTERQRHATGAAVAQFAAELQSWVTRFRAECEIIDADCNTFEKYTERNVYWNARLVVDGLAKELKGMGDRLQGQDVEEGYPDV
jgi:hypothetical protein